MLFIFYGLDAIGFYFFKDEVSSMYVNIYCLHKNLIGFRSSPFGLDLVVLDFIRYFFCDLNMYLETFF